MRSWIQFPLLLGIEARAALRVRETLTSGHFSPTPAQLKEAFLAASNISFRLAGSPRCVCASAQLLLREISFTKKKTDVSVSVLPSFHSTRREEKVEVATFQYIFYEENLPEDPKKTKPYREIIIQQALPFHWWLLFLLFFSSSSSLVVEFELYIRSRPGREGNRMSRMAHSYKAC